MKQVILKINEQADPKEKFIISELDELRLLIKPDKEDTLKQQVESIMTRNMGRGEEEIN